MYINAALLHEMRMVVQHASKLFRREKSGQGGSGLLCVTCLRKQNFIVKKAVTVTRGNAVCLEHIS